MIICFLSHCTNYHTLKWCKYFADRGHEVHVVSFEPGSIENVKVHFIDIGINRGGSDLHKIRYLLSGKKIKNKVKQLNPDIVHVHFATSYGVACALSGLPEYFLSVWGYDIYDFPKKSILHKLVLKYSLHKATKILSTSRAMAEETAKYTQKHIDITPFGVDTEIFKPEFIPDKDKGLFVVGVIKLLTYKYGIDVLIRAFKIFIDNNPNINCQLRIGGNGPYENELRKLVHSLNLEEKVIWLGFIPEQIVIQELNRFDVAVVPSDTESFGVSAVEAEACEVPLIVTNVGGLPEATYPGISSIIVPPRNPEAIAKALEKLYYDKPLRDKMGKDGRRYVLQNFKLQDNFRNIEGIYEQYLNKSLL